jgi:N-acetylglucosaminyldiphosphoundecaprenol N-acetyl-beta-D-mannosaminyltransferase
MQRHGLEWLFRLCSEPRRLWRRYAYIVPGFTILAVGDLVRRAIRPSNDAHGLSHTSERGWKPESRAKE